MPRTDRRRGAPGPAGPPAPAAPRARAPTTSPRSPTALVALHSTDPVTVHLSAMVRMVHPSVAAVERALYDDRSVVRHHAMRRTLWVATPGRRPADARGGHRAAGRRGAPADCVRLLARQRRRRPRGVAGGRPRTRCWPRCTSTVRSPPARSAPGSPAVTHKIVMAPGKKWSATVSAHTRVLLQPRVRGRDRCAPGRPAPGSTAPTPTPRRLLARRAGWADRTERARRRRAGAALAAGVRPRHGDRPAVVDGLDRGDHPVGAGRLRGRRGRARRGARLGGAGRRGAGRAGRARGWRCCPGSTRRRWAGSSGTGTSPTPCADTLRPDGQRRPDDLGRRRRSSAAGCRPRTARSAPAASSTCRPAAGRGRRGGRPRWPPCWGRPGSPCGSPAPCRPRCVRVTGSGIGRV